MSNTVTSSSIEAIAASTGSNTSDVHEAFASERRQTILRVLARNSTPVDVSAVARAVAARETDSSIGSVPPDQVEEVHVMLYHVHLPKLEALGLVEYDAVADVVTDYVDELDGLAF